MPAIKIGNFIKNPNWSDWYEVIEVTDDQIFVKYNGSTYAYPKAPDAWDWEFKPQGPRVPAVGDWVNRDAWKEPDKFYEVVKVDGDKAYLAPWEGYSGENGGIGYSISNQDWRFKDEV